MILRFYDFRNSKLRGLTPWSKWVALVGTFGSMTALIPALERVVLR